MEIKIMTVYVVWTNTDLTEGRGYQIPIAVCKAKATAIRLSKKRGVMGSDAFVTKTEAILRDGHWCAPVQLINPSKEDELTEKQFKAEEEKQYRRTIALQKAREAGLSDEDLEALR